MNYEVFNDRILLKELDLPVELKTEGGLYVPNSVAETEKRSFAFGEVVLKGATTKLVEVGDTIIYDPRSTQTLHLDGKKYLLTGEPMLIGKKIK